MKEGRGGVGCLILSMKRDNGTSEILLQKDELNV